MEQLDLRTYRQHIAVVPQESFLFEGSVRSNVTYGNDDLVVVMLGDHQPATIVSGEDAGRDVPISLITRDQAVFDKMSGWGWSAGLRPETDAPVWRMDAFRDRFLAAYGLSGETGPRPGGAG